MMWENIVAWGKLLNLTLTEDSAFLITASSNTVVSVFRLEQVEWMESSSKSPLKKERKEHRTFNIKHVGDLYGHREAVTLVTASRIHSLVVSASADKRVMMWDLLRLRHIRTLPEHTHAITALKIHSLTGTLVVCTEREIALWSVNGDLLASNGSLRSMEPITAVAFGHGQEWAPHNITCITGHADGSIEFWTAVEDQMCRLQRFGAPTAQSPVTALFMRPDDKALYSGNATGQVILWSSEEELEAERAQRNKEISTSLARPEVVDSPGGISERRRVDSSPLRNLTRGSAYLSNLPNLAAGWRHN